MLEGTNSRAYRYLIEQKDLAVGISGTAYTPAFPGLFIITGTMKGSVPSSKAEEALNHVITAYSGQRSNGRGSS